MSAQELFGGRGSAPSQCRAGWAAIDDFGGSRRTWSEDLPGCFRSLTHLNYGSSRGAAWCRCAVAEHSYAIASDVLNDLITSVLVALAAVIASGLLDRIWDAL
jgi:hypothetical protein